MLNKPITFDSFIRGCIYVAVFVGALYLISYLSGVLLPFFIAWGIAYLIFPMVEFVQYRMRVRSRALSISLTLCLIIAVLSLLCALIIPPFIEESLRFKSLIVNYIHNRTNNQSIPDLVNQFVRDYFETSDWKALLSDGNVIEIVRQVAPGVGGLLTQTYHLMNSIVTFAATLLYLFFILLDYEQIAKGWKRLLPAGQHSNASSVIGKVRSNMGSYFRSQSIIALCVGVLFAVGFSIIDFPMAIGLGLFVGLLNLVPYLQLVGLIPTVLLALLKASDTGENFWVILFMALAVFAVVQLIQDLVLTPRIMGKAMGLNPAMMLLSLSIWGALLGFIGLIIGLPLTNIIVAYIEELVLNSRNDGLAEFASPDNNEGKEHTGGGNPRCMNSGFR